MKRYFAEGLLILTTIIWGATFTVVKGSLSSVSPMVFISSRFLFALLLLLPFTYTIFKGTNFLEIKGGLILGFLYFMGFLTQTVGLVYTSATKSAFITGTFVVFTPLFQLLFEKRSPTKWNLIGILLVVAGLIFLSSKGTSYFHIFSELGTNFNFGDFLTLLCAVFYSLYMVYLDIISKKVRAMPLVYLQIAVTAVGGIILMYIFNVTGVEPMRTDYTSYVIGALLYTSILATLVTTGLQTNFQKYVSPTKAGIIFSFEPIFASIFAYILIKERLGSFGVIGGIFIFAGLLVTEIFDKKFAEI